MHEQQPRERAATTHEQQPHERAAARCGLDQRSGSASRSSSLRQREQIQRLAAALAVPATCGSPSSSSDFRQPQQFQQFPANRKEFVFSRIERKQKKKKHGTSTTDEGESCKQLVSPPQQSPSNHSFSYRNHSEEQTLTNSDQQLQNQIFSYPGNLIQQDTITYPQSINPVLPPNSHLELQVPLDHPSVTHNFAENDFQGENLDSRHDGHLEYITLLPIAKLLFCFF
ncbi:hypothetical protein WN943_023308 [Citrus x changshan-huyou]